MVTMESTRRYRCSLLVNPSIFLPFPVANVLFAVLFWHSDTVCGIAGAHTQMASARTAIAHFQVGRDPTLIT